VNPALELLLFAGIMALAQFSPGPDMILLTRTSLAYGACAGITMACGIATGLALHAGIALSGGAYIFSDQSFFLPYAKTAASLYLCYLAWQIWRSHPPSLAEPRSTTSPRHYLRGLLCNLLNPKAALVLTSLCAPFLHSKTGLTRPLALGTIIVGQGALLWSLWAIVLQSPVIRHGYERAHSMINRSFAAVLIFLAALLWLPTT
jgi:threonine efflux protein